MTRWYFPKRLSKGSATGSNRNAGMWTCGSGNRIFFALSLIAGYRLAPRIGYWVCMVAPLIFVIGFLAFETILIWVLQAIYGG